MSVSNPRPNFEFQAAQFVHVGRILLFNSRIDFDNFDLYF